MALEAPRWDVSNIYPSLKSPEFTWALKDLRKLISELESFFDTSVEGIGGDTAPDRLGPVLGEAVDRFNEVYNLSGTLEAYIYAFVSTDSGNQKALRIQSEFEMLTLPIKNLEVRLKARLGEITPVLDKALEYSPSAKTHAFILREGARLSTFLMSRQEEELAAELSLSGGNAWDKLQSRVVSSLTADLELDGKAKKLSMPELINLRSHPDEEVRRRAYHRENEAWDSVRDTLAACLNGVKGEVVTLNKHRGREDALEPALDQARIDRPTLEAMLEAVRDSLPVFETYYRHKAKLLGKKQLPWWDIFAPVGKSGGSLEFGETRDFILRHFEDFSPELRNFADRAFEKRWIDAEVREGKHAGGFCMEVPGVKESRILVNYDGSQDQIATIAHELGHAFHNECAYQKDKTVLQQSTPMTLAETASTFCELIVTEAVLAGVANPEEELAVLETQLNGASQVVVDIYSRYLFETEVFQCREKAELSADEFCEIMENAQKTAFGDSIDERYLQKYMWTWKPHYYSTEVSFYNFPYTFGLLFGTGLYAVYRERGAGFMDDYKALLASTGEAPAADLALRFGIDIRSRQFWDRSLAIIGERIERYREL